MTPEQELSLAEAKALHKSAVVGKTVREPEGDFGSAIGTADDLLIVAFAPTAEGAEQGRDAVLAALAFASESSPSPSVDEREIQRLQSCEEAWGAVWEALKLADPAMSSRSAIGQECATLSIQALAAERDAARAELSLAKAKASEPLWILTREINQYDQDGEYFVAAWRDRPTVEHLRLHIPYEDEVQKALESGGGRMLDRETWYNLEQQKEQAK